MKRVFALIDCDHFYCSCEALFHQAAGERPAIVLGNNDGCVVSRNRAAKALKIKVGMPLFQIRRLVEQRRVLVYSSNYALYADISRRVMAVLAKYAPHREVSSIDEAWLDLSHIPSEELVAYGHRIRDAVKQQVGIPCSIGIAPSKVLGKVACELVKTSPNRYRGVLSVVGMAQDELDDLLRWVLVEDLWGIGKARASSLHKQGIITALALKGADHLWVRHLLGVQVQRVVLELRGMSCLPLQSTPRARQHIAVALSFRQPVERCTDLEEAISHYTARAAEKLRRHHLQTGHLSVFLQTNPFDTHAPQYAGSRGEILPLPTAFTPDLMQHARALLRQLYRPGYLFKRVGVQFARLTPEEVFQPDLFDAFVWEEQAKQARLMAVVDLVNHYLGRETLFWGAQGLERAWFVKRERLSPQYTTRWSDLPRVQA